ncbi:MAG: tryptophan synthase subunit alpha [Bacteroidetes bacterium]|nr:tryptophan synthase subunit alpha [Bacteroidota bacterium]
MNRITQLFKKNNNHKILSVYFTAGYPNLNGTLPILEALEKQGVDLAEIGIPFSDPMADGPVIQNSAGEALRNGMSLRLLFEQLKEVRQTVQMPLILMGYLNPIMQYGFERFCQSCSEAGIDGMIIPDLPFSDYLANYKKIADAHDLKMIMLITPETSEERIRLIDQNTDGFIYLVSSASTTGAQQQFDESKKAYFTSVANMKLKNPLLVGFGISNKSTLEAASAHTSGAIIGSKFIQMLGECATPDEAVKALLNSLK